MCQEASSSCVGQMPYFLCSLCLSKSKPCYYQPLKKTWLSVVVLICYWKPFFAFILPSIPALILLLMSGFLVTLYVHRLSSLAAAFWQKLTIRTSVASLKLGGKFEIGGFCAQYFPFLYIFPFLTSALHHVALFESFSGSSARWIIALGIVWLPQEKQYVLHMQKRSVLIISHFNNSRASVSSSFCGSSWDRAPKCFL